jgi:hypothetical protein
MAMSKAFCYTLAMFFAACTCLGAKGKPQGAPVIGQIVLSSGATVDGVPALNGSTLLAGDTIATPKDRGALVKVPGNAQVELSESTIVSFSGTPGHVIAKIAQGMIVAQEPDADTLAIETSQCRIRAVPQGNATCEVSLAPGGSATITVRTGSVLILGIGSGQERALAQGETFVCPAVPEAAAAPQAVPEAAAAPQAPEEIKPAPGEAAPQAPPSQAKHSNTALWLLLLGGGAAAGIGAAVAAGGHGGGGGGPASPSAP